MKLDKTETVVATIIEYNQIEEYYIATFKSTRFNGSRWIKLYFQDGYGVKAEENKVVQNENDLLLNRPNFSARSLLSKLMMVTGYMKINGSYTAEGFSWYINEEFQQLNKTLGPIFKAYIPHKDGSLKLINKGPLGTLPRNTYPANVIFKIKAIDGEWEECENPFKQFAVM